MKLEMACAIPAHRAPCSWTTSAFSGHQMGGQERQLKMDKSRRSGGFTNSTAFSSKHWGVRVFDCVRRSSGCVSTVLIAGTLARCARRAIWPSGEGTVGCGCWSRAFRPFALRPACPSCSLARAAPPAAVPGCWCALDPQPPAGALLTLGSGFMRRPSVGLWRRLLR